MQFDDFHFTLSPSLSIYTSHTYCCLYEFNCLIQVLPKKQKQLSEIPAAVTLWEEFDPVIIKSEDLILKEILGEGNFGKVYQGEWIRRLGGHEVAVSTKQAC